MGSLIDFTCLTPDDFTRQRKKCLGPSGLTSVVSRMYFSLSKARRLYISPQFLYTQYRCLSIQTFIIRIGFKHH